MRKPSDYKGTAGFTAGPFPGGEGEDVLDLVAPEPDTSTDPKWFDKKGERAWPSPTTS